MRSTMVRRRILKLKQEADSILKAVLYPERMISGGLVKRWIKCGKAGCRCQQGELHGPYYYLSVLEAGKPRLFYLGKDEKPEVLLLKKYQTFQRRIARLNSAHREMVELLWELAEKKIRKFDKGGDSV